MLAPVQEIRRFEVRVLAPIASKRVDQAVAGIMRGATGTGNVPGVVDLLGPARSAYPRLGMPTRRTNEQWLRDLRSEGSAQTSALEDLRAYLLRALPGTLKRYGGMPEDLLEDVVQDSLLRTLDQLHRFEGRSRFTTWATTITVRAAMTELRRRRWKDVSLEEVTRETR